MAGRLAVAFALGALLAGCLGAPAGLPPGAGLGAPALSCDPCKVGLDQGSGSGWEPHVAVSPLDPDHIVVATRTADGGPLPGMFMLWFDLHVSTDGGQTWTLTPMRYTQPLGTSTDPTAPNVVGDPVLAFLPDGTLLITGATLQYLEVPPNAAGAILHARLFVTRSPDGGFTLEQPVVVVESEGVVVQSRLPAPAPPLALPLLFKLADKPWLATGPDGTALLAWASIVAFHPDEPAGVRSDILFSVSSDGGRTWSAPGKVERGGSLQGPSVAIGTAGAWYVAYGDFEAQQGFVATSHDQGARWTRAPVGASAWMPSLALARAPGGDRLSLVLAQPVDGQAAPGQPDSVAQVPALWWSDAAATAWEGPLLLDAPGSPGRALPSVAVDGAGVVYVSYAVPTGGDAAEFRAAALLPGREASRITLDPAVGVPSSRMGDYLGLAAGSRGAFTVWTTTADGQPYTAGARLRADP